MEKLKNECRSLSLQADEFESTAAALEKRSREQYCGLRLVYAFERGEGMDREKAVKAVEKLLARSVGAGRERLRNG